MRPHLSAGCSVMDTGVQTPLFSTSTHAGDAHRNGATPLGGLNRLHGTGAGGLPGDPDVRDGTSAVQTHAFHLNSCYQQTLMICALHPATLWLTTRVRSLHITVPTAHYEPKRFIMFLGTTLDRLFSLIPASSSWSRLINNHCGTPTELLEKAVNIFNNLQHKHSSSSKPGWNTFQKLREPQKCLKEKKKKRLQRMHLDIWNAHFFQKIPRVLVLPVFLGLPFTEDICTHQCPHK